MTVQIHPQVRRVMSPDQPAPSVPRQVQPERERLSSASAAKVAIIEDHALLAQSLGFTLEATGLEVLVPRLSSGVQLLEEVRRFRPDLILLDLELGDPIGDGTRLISHLVAMGARVLVMTSVTDRLRLAATLEAGAVGFLNKTAPVDVLIDTVARGTQGEDVMDATVRHDLLFELRRKRREEQVRDRAFARLTPREREVLVALAEGKTVACLAREWTVAQTTIRSQVRGILTKFGVSSQLEAVAMARKCGWLQDPEAHR